MIIGTLKYWGKLNICDLLGAPRLPYQIYGDIRLRPARCAQSGIQPWGRGTAYGMRCRPVVQPWGFIETIRNGQLREQRHRAGWAGVPRWPWVEAAAWPSARRRLHGPHPPRRPNSRLTAPTRPCKWVRFTSTYPRNTNATLGGGIQRLWPEAYHIQRDAEPV